MTAVCAGMSILLLVCAGCTHYHRVVNIGDSMLYAVTVQSGDTRFGHGYLPSGCSASYRGSMRIVRSPAPEVSWKTSADGHVMSQAVDLDVEPGSREVVFELDGKGARAILRDR